MVSTYDTSSNRWRNVCRTLRYRRPEKSSPPLQDFHPVASLNTYMESFYTLHKPMAATIKAPANAVDKVFSASSDEAREEMRQASVNYLGLGGIYTAGAMALLSGLNPSPTSLLSHFFAMAKNIITQSIA